MAARVPDVPANTGDTVIRVVTDRGTGLSVQIHARYDGRLGKQEMSFTLSTGSPSATNRSSSGSPVRRVPEPMEAVGMNRPLRETGGGGFFCRGVGCGEKELAREQANGQDAVANSLQTNEHAQTHFQSLLYWLYYLCDVCIGISGARR